MTPIVRQADVARPDRRYLCRVETRLSALRARARAWPPLRIDAALGLLVVVEGAVEMALVDAADGDRLTGWGAVWLIAAGVGLRRRLPLAAVALAFAGLAVVSALPAAIPDGTQGPWLAALFVVFSMAAHSDGRALLAGIAVAAAGTAVVSIVGDSHGTDYLFAILLFIAAPVAGGQLLRSRVRLNEALSEK